MTGPGVSGVFGAADQQDRFDRQTGVENGYSRLGGKLQFLRLRLLHVIHGNVLHGMGMVDRLSARFRERRMRWFLDICQPERDTLVLDVGGNPQIWNLIPESRRPRVVYLNLPRAHEDGDDRARLVFGDGLHLPFADHSFDLVFSNSVIEHVGNATNQARFASEIRRVARRRYWVQTPNRGFPVEQHLLTPFLHWLPTGLRAAVARRFTVWEWIARPSAASRDYYVEHFLRDIRLLRKSEMTRLFPDATAVAGERMGPLVKSWVAYRV